MSACHRYGGGDALTGDTPRIASVSVSPELALVDPVLRQRLLSLAGECTPVQIPPPPPSRTRCAVQLRHGASWGLAPRRPGFTLPSAAAGRWSSPSRLRSRSCSGRSSRVRPSSARRRSAWASASQLPVAPRLHVLSRGSQRLEWAPVAGADGYEVAIYRGGQRVFAAHTPVPRLDLAWSVRRELPRGILAWYVWPTRKGGIEDTSPFHPVVRSLLSSSVLRVGR